MKSKLLMLGISLVATASLSAAVAVSNIDNQYAGTTYPQSGYSAGNGFTTGNLLSTIVSIDVYVPAFQFTGDASDFTMTLYSGSTLASGTEVATFTSAGALVGDSLSFTGNYNYSANSEYTWIVSALGADSLPIGLTDDNSETSPDGWVITNNLTTLSSGNTGSFTLPAKFQVNVADAIPEPSSAMMLGALGLLALRRKRTA
jgi:PEP-CTERM motif